MDHILGKWRGTSAEDIKQLLASDAARHAKEGGLLLRHVWRNADDADETLFIFTTENLEHARKFIEMEHEKTRKVDPNANLPEILYLKGV